MEKQGDTGKDPTPFVGRNEELEQIRRCFMEACSGRPRLALIAGEAGMGKTCLLNRLRPELERGSIVLSGRCYEDTSMPYVPWVEALRSCLEQKPDACASVGEAEAEIILRLLGKSGERAVLTTRLPP
jgi:predicted ATPase